jgi:hypothetical protein
LTRWKARGCPIDTLEAAERWRRENVIPRPRRIAAPPLPPAQRPADASRANDGEVLDLALERARHIRAQRIEVEGRIQKFNENYAAVELLSSTLAAACAGIAQRMEHIRGELRRRHPDLPAAVLDSIDAVLATARNQIADAAIGDAKRLLAELDDEPTDDEETTP